MIADILKTVFISLLLIVLLHYSYNYLQDTLTVPKVKDLVDRPKEKYDSIMKVVNSVPNTTEGQTTQDSSPSSFQSSFQPPIEQPSSHPLQQDAQNMQNELNSYVSQINNQGNIETTAVNNMNQVPIEQTNGRFMNTGRGNSVINQNSTHTSNVSSNSSSESTSIDALPSL